MYLSDYLYGVLASSCSRSNNNNAYNQDYCGGKDWLYRAFSEWIISPNSSVNDEVWYIQSGAWPYYSETYNIPFVRPVLYLSPSVYKISGTGTLMDPYIIGM